MAPIRAKRENLDALRQIGIEHPVVPVGRLMEGVPLGEARDFAGNAIALAVLFELEHAAPLAAEARRELRARSEQRRHEIREAARLLKIAPL